MNMKPSYSDPLTQWYQGDVKDILPELTPGSVDCIVTSPPYYGLRCYSAEPVLWDNHNGCEHEWGEYKTDLFRPINPVVSG